MNSPLIITIFSILGMVIMAVWGQLDKRVEHTIGATLAGALMIASLGLGLSGRWVPEGASLLIFGVLVWFITLGSVSFGKGSHS